MTNLFTPLKKLGKKMTGKDIDGTDLVAVVDDIANKYDGGGGGAEPLEIIITNEDNVYTLDKTFSEIAESFPNCYVKQTYHDSNPEVTMSSQVVAIDFSTFSIFTSTLGNITLEEELMNILQWEEYSAQSADDYPIMTV